MSLIEKIKNIGEKRTVLFYITDYPYPFRIEFEGKTFNSKLISNSQCVILDIPYNARITVNAIAENAIEITLDDSGSSLEEYFKGNNLLLNLQNILGEPHE